MKNKKPIVTFLVPAFNVEDYLGACIDGIYSQSFKNFFVLIINDCSSDKTAQMLRKIKDSRFSIINLKKNQGYIRCLNLGLSLIKTEYTARLDADDIPMPKRLEKQINFLEANSRVAVVGSRMGYIWGNRDIFSIKTIGKKIIPSFCPKMNYSPFWDPVNDGETIPHSSATFRTHVVRSVGAYRNLFPAEDMDLWYRLAIKGLKLACLPEILTLYRINPKGATSSALFRQAMVTEFVKQSLSSCLKKRPPPSFEKFSKRFRLSAVAKGDLKFKGDLRRAMGLFLSRQYSSALWQIFKIAIIHPARLTQKIKSRL
jgi:glycosyltransferase involved in cell wall biosynthesis